MLDSEYFRKVLQSDVDAAGGDVVVEVHVLGRRTLRLRSVVAVQAGYVTFEVYRGHEADGSLGARGTRWRGKGGEAEARPDIRRAVVAYDSIVEVTITPVADGGAAIGFGRP